MCLSLLLIVSIFVRRTRVSSKGHCGSVAVSASWFALRIRPRTPASSFVLSTARPRHTSLKRERLVWETGTRGGCPPYRCCTAPSLFSSIQPPCSGSKVRFHRPSLRLLLHSHAPLRPHQALRVFFNFSFESVFPSATKGGLAPCRRLRNSPLQGPPDPVAPLSLFPPFTHIFALFFVGGGRPLSSRQFILSKCIV